MKNPVNKSQGGVSVVEMLVVVAVIIILTAFAVAQFGNSASNLDRQNIAREFKVVLERARFDSVKRRPGTCAEMSMVVINSATRFTLLADTNQNGIVEPALESRVTDFGGRSNVQIVGDGLTFPINIRFDHRGNATSGDCSSPTPVVATTTFCNMPCSDLTAGGGNSNIIFVSPTGTASMLAGGSTTPTFSNPSVSNVDSNIQVNPMLSVFDPDTAPAPSPSASPSASIDPLPTISPLPSIDPSPLPSISPTASPTPTPLPACAWGVRPGNPATCVCLEPMWIRASGKCQ